MRSTHHKINAGCDDSASHLTKCENSSFVIFGIEQSETGNPNELKMTKEHDTLSVGASATNDLSALSNDDRNDCTHLDLTNETIRNSSANEFTSSGNISNKLTGSCPSAMPTPLLGYCPPSSMPSMMLPSDLPSGPLSLANSPDPNSIITHFDIVHHHMERSAVSLHNAMMTSMDVATANITRKIEEGNTSARVKELEKAKAFKLLEGKVEALMVPLESLSTKVANVEKSVVDALHDRIETVVKSNKKMNNTIDMLASRIGELEKKLDRAQQQQQQLSHRKTPRYNRRTDSLQDSNNIVRTASSQSPPIMSSIQASRNAAVNEQGLSYSSSASKRMSSTAPPSTGINAAVTMPSPTTMAYHYYNYAAPTVALSRQQLQQMDKESRRAYMQAQALQYGTPDLNQHPAFASDKSMGSGGVDDGYYLQDYGYGLR